MAAYPQNTPSLRARGRYKVRAPFTVSDDLDYTCIAIRSFKDMYREGTNPYTNIYVPVGLTDGSIHAEDTFNFANEEIRGINIVTLADDKGRNILIPDNYIISYPMSSTINYLEFVMSCSLGALPENIDLTVAKQAMIDAVASQFGVSVDVNVHTLPTTTNPTYEEHLALEQARFAAMNINSTSVDTINKLTAELELRNQTIRTMSQILIDNNLMPTNQ